MKVGRKKFKVFLMTGILMNCRLLITNRMIITPILLLGLQGFGYGEDTDWDPSPVEKKQLAETIGRFFSGTGGYQAGDLISRSQVTELQQFLRKTRGPIPAVHPNLSQRVIPDASPLVKLFHQENGSTVLRTAANSLGGYARIERFSQTMSGRVAIGDAILHSSSDTLVELVEAQFPTKPPTDASDIADKPEGQKFSRIYTAEEFILAAIGGPQKNPDLTVTPAKTNYDLNSSGSTNP